MDFPGFTVNSVTMETRHPGEKIKSMRSETKKLQEMGAPQALTLSRLLGQFNSLMHSSHSTCQPPMFYRNPQHCLQASLGGGGQEYSTPVYLAPEAMEGLKWWHQHMTRWNGRYLLSQKPTLTIETCLHDRMGSNVSENLDRRSMVKDREADSHQLP